MHVNIAQNSCIFYRGIGFKSYRKFLQLLQSKSFALTAIFFSFEMHLQFMKKVSLYWKFIFFLQRTKKKESPQARLEPMTNQQIPRTLPSQALFPTSAYTANISAVKITVFRRVPFPDVIPLYYLHLITALSTVEKCKHRFTVVYYKIYTFTW